jgi:hypothetical protein
MWDPPFIWVLREIYWGTAAATPPINLESDIGLPNTILLGELYWGTAGDALMQMMHVTLP